MALLPNRITTRPAVGTNNPSNFAPRPIGSQSVSPPALPTRKPPVAPLKPVVDPPFVDPNAPVAPTPAGRNHPARMTPEQRSALQASFDSFMKGGGLAGNRVWDGFAALDTALRPPQQGGGNKPGNPTGPHKPTPPPQWTFQPNAYDQSPYGAAGAQGAAGPGPASQYTVNLPTQPWMLNPMGQAPQPQPPQDQQSLQYYQQWAPPYRT